MFHLHFVGLILFDFIMRVMKFIVASRGHFGGVDRHGGPDFSLRLIPFVVKHLEKDGTRFGRLQLCVETPLDDRTASIKTFGDKDDFMTNSPTKSKAPLTIQGRLALQANSFHLAIGDVLQGLGLSALIALQFHCINNTTR
jgi:hypothetical protein